MKKDVHVIPDGKTWKVTLDNRIIEFEEQEAAESRGRKLARERKVELYLHGMDGKIRQRDSYGQDCKIFPS